MHIDRSLVDENLSRSVSDPLNDIFKVYVIRPPDKGA